MNIHIILHESFEAPGAIATWAGSRGHSITYTRLYDKEHLPKDASGFDFLVIMGGPQSPATTTDECSYFDVKKESALAKNAINNGKYVFGVCLGAQIIGEALDAIFDHSPNREIGFFPIALTEVGKNDPLLQGFPDTFVVGHWHGDMPGLTSTSQILATSVGCPRQIVRYTPKVYGFQCHLEFTSESIEGMIANSGKELSDNAGLPYVWPAAKLRGHGCKPMNELLFTFLDRLTQQP